MLVSDALQITNKQTFRFVRATVTLPEEYLGRVIELCEANRGVQKSLEFFNATQVILVYDMPAAQLVDDLFGKLKGATYVTDGNLFRHGRRVRD